MSDDANKEKDFTPKGEAEIRQEVTEEYNFDADADKERIEKLTKERLDAQEKLSTAIKQKKSRREEAERHAAKLRELGYDPETGKKIETQQEKKEEPDKNEDDEVRQRLDRVEMELAGNFSEEIQKNIREYAKLNKVSYKEAAKSEFIQFLVSKEEMKKKNDEAALGGGDGGTGTGSRKVDSAKPADLKNLSDEEYAKWKEKNLK